MFNILQGWQPLGAVYEISMIKFYSTSKGKCAISLKLKTMVYIVLVKARSSSLLQKLDHAVQIGVLAHR